MFPNVLNDLSVDKLEVGRKPLKVIREYNDRMLRLEMIGVWMPDNLSKDQGGLTTMASA